MGEGDGIFEANTESIRQGAFRAGHLQPGRYTPQTERGCLQTESHSAKYRNAEYSKTGYSAATDSSANHAIEPSAACTPASQSAAVTLHRNHKASGYINPTLHVESTTSGRSA